MRLTMHIKGQLNYRDIVVPIDVIGKLKQLGKIRHNANLLRWEITVPTQEVYNRYIAHFKPRRAVA